MKNKLYLIIILSTDSTMPVWYNALGCYSVLESSLAHMLLGSYRHGLKEILDQIKHINIKNITEIV